jgi:hypothetical protein
MSTPQEARPSGWLVPVFLLLAFAAGVGIVFVGVRDLARVESLGDDAVTIEARVTDTRVMTYRKRGDSYEVRYSFDVAGRTYAYADSTGRSDLWVSLEPSAWDTARAKGTTPVRYLPTDPSNNVPVHQATEPVFAHVAGIVVGLFCMLPTVLWARAALRRARAAKA